MIKRPRLVLILFLVLSFSAFGEEERDINSLFKRFEKKLISNPTELDKLGLFGTDFHAQEYLDELLANFWEGLEHNNYYLVFYQAFSTSRRKVSQIRSGNLNLKAYIRVSKNEDNCSTYQSLNYSVIKHGLGLASSLQGICGQIATIHSLKKLGIKKSPFNKKYIKEKCLQEVTPKEQKNKISMTAKELAQLHKKYTGKQCRIYRHVCTLDTKKIPASHMLTVKRLAQKGLKTFVANLYKQFNSNSPKYDCSLGMTSYDIDGRKKLSHIEHITKVAINPRSKKAMIVTKNGFLQGDMKKTVPAYPGSNSFSIDPENLKCYFERSTHRGVDTIYKNASIDKVQAICCPL